MQDAVNREQIFAQLNSLVSAWCERRCLTALRYILQGWPLSSGLTDDWQQLLESLKNTRAFARHELEQQEVIVLDKMIGSVDVLIRQG